MFFSIEDANKRQRVHPEIIPMVKEKFMPKPQKVNLYHKKITFYQHRTSETRFPSYGLKKATENARGVSLELQRRVLHV